MNTFAAFTRTVALLAAVVLLASCDSFVSGVEEPDDVVEGERLNDPDQVPFLISGVQAVFADTYDNIGTQAGGLSDELIFTTNIGSATFPSFRDIDNGEPTTSNNSVDGIYNNLGEFRRLADDLAQRAQNEIDFGDDTALQNRALYVGHFYGGVARYFYATYFGLNPTEGGGVIDESTFIPSAEMYDRAIADFDSALTAVGGDAYEGRLLNTMKARSYLFKAGLEGADADQAYQNAQSAAQAGLVAGDAPFQSLYTLEADNDWYFDAGPGRAQFIAANRYAQQYEETAILSSPDADALAEASDTARVAMYLIGGLAPGQEGFDAAHPPLSVTQVENDDGELVDAGVFPQQGLYLERDSPIDFATWQENALMRAELALRLGGDDDPLALVNSVRASHSLGELGSVSLDGDEDGDGTADVNTIVVERDKELFGQGLRLPDQRRFGIPFDVAATGAAIPGPWRYLPITESERNTNPNL